MNINLDVKPLLEKLATNGITLLWLKDPITKFPSVSLTTLVISLVFVILSILSNYFVVLKGLNAELSFNFFCASSALYFGRKIVISGKNASLEKLE